MVELLGTEIEWSISPPESYSPRSSSEFQKSIEEYHEEFSQFACSTEISLRYLDNLFLRLCNNKKLFENLSLLPYKAGDNMAWLSNGSILYKDSTGHFESTTPECRNVFDAAGYEVASELILQSLISRFAARQGYEETPLMLKYNSDGIESWAYHENYSIASNLGNNTLYRILTFLTTREIFSSPGHIRDKSITTRDSTIDDYFELSPRAKFIRKSISGHATVGSEASSERPVIMSRDESLMDSQKYRRIQIVSGNPTMFPYTTALKLGTTKLVLELLEIMPGFSIPGTRIPPEEAIKQISIHPYDRLELESGERLTPLEIQRKYCLEPAIKHFQGKSKETDWILYNWGLVLDLLKDSKKELPETLIGFLDWPTKRYLLGIFADNQKLTLPGEEALLQLKWKDKEFHNIDLGMSLIFPYLSASHYYPLNPEGILHRSCTPPKTRALIRGTIVKHFPKETTGISWQSLSLKRGIIDLGNVVELKQPEKLLHSFQEENPDLEKFITLCKEEQEVSISPPSKISEKYLIRTNQGNTPPEGPAFSS